MSLRTLRGGLIVFGVGKIDGDMLKVSTSLQFAGLWRMEGLKSYTPFNPWTMVGKVNGRNCINVSLSNRSLRSDAGNYLTTNIVYPPIPR